MVDFEPLYTTPRAEAVARFLELNYPLAAPLSCRMLQRGFNDNYLVVASTGERFVFRISHPRARGPADVATETAFIAHLERLGAAVAAPVATLAGALHLSGDAPEGARTGVLFRALEGRIPSPASAADARATGATLARVHDGAASFRATAPLYRLDLDHLVRRPLARAIDSGLIDDADARQKLSDIAERTAARIESFAELTWTHCHGDCHGLNSRILPDGRAAFFDFDDGGPGHLAYDLSVFLWAKISFGRKLLRMWEAFLEGYRTVRPLLPQDLEAAQSFVVARHFWIMGEYASRAGEWGSESVDWIAGQANFLGDWERERFRDWLL